MIKIFLDRTLFLALFYVYSCKSLYLLTPLFAWKLLQGVSKVKKLSKLSSKLIKFLFSQRDHKKVRFFRWFVVISLIVPIFCVIYLTCFAIDIGITEHSEDKDTVYDYFIFFLPVLKLPFTIYEIIVAYSLEKEFEKEYSSIVHQNSETLVAMSDE